MVVTCRFELRCFGLPDYAEVEQTAASIDADEMR
jgi:hypothetical protein